jgi:replicative DNA helicase
MQQDAKIIRPLPSHLEAEKVMLGLIILNNEMYGKIAAIIDSDDFYSEIHRKIFNAIIELNSNSITADLITLKDELQRRNQLDEIGGISYISSLVNGLPSLENIEDYAHVIKEKSQFRDIIEIGDRLANAAYKQEDNVEDIIEKAEKSLFLIRQEAKTPGFEAIKDIAKMLWDKVEKIYERGDLLTGLTTGYTDLDNLTSGMQNGELIIIAGRPSMGKTTLSLNIAQHLAVKHKKTIGIYSLEMPKDLLVLRMLCSEARVDSKALKNAQLNNQDWSNLAIALCSLAETKIYINDFSGITPADIKTQARRLKEEHGLDLLIIDYLQLIRPKGRYENRQQEITAISLSLKEAAKELNIPIIALSQLSRSPESRRDDHRPILADLRESGSLEQDADTVLFIYRDEIYNKNTKDKGSAEIIIAKQRNGPVGSVYLTFFSEYTRFENQFREQRTDRYRE